MAITPLKVLLFLAGASGAASGTAYVAGAFDPYLPAAAVAQPFRRKCAGRSSCAASR